MTQAGVKLASVALRSPAAAAGLRAGDRILAVDGNPVEDALDLAYAAAEERFQVVFQRGAAPKRRAQVVRRAGKPWGAQAEPPGVRHCGNQCVFCFVDQMPRGLRSTLYVKDEDYRHSFLHGNYVTLTRLTEREIEKIIRLRLSPLYVSVHATDSKIRQRLLGRERLPSLLPLLRRLAKAGIAFHTQAVLCPGWNDGKALEKTVRDLAALFPAVQSLALVPVGLTQHREKLANLKPFTRPQSERLLRRVERWQKAFLKKHKTRWVYATDEWYLRAGRPIPPAREYEDFPQRENGVGLARLFLDAVRQNARALPGRVHPGRHVLVAAGELSAPLVRRAVRPFRRVAGLNVEVVAVPNRLFGGQVGVSGLLSGRDILEALLPRAGNADLILLPPEPVRSGKGDVFLDDMKVNDLQKALGVRVRVLRDLRNWTECILRG